MKIIKKFFCTFLVFMILLYSISNPILAANYNSQYFKEQIYHPNIGYFGQPKKKNGYDRKVYDKPTYKIPGLDTDFIPQGLCEIKYNNTVYHLITAYHYATAHKDIYPKETQRNSRIYIIDVAKQTHIRTVDIENTHGKHFGGITEYKNKIFIASTGILYIINKSDLFTYTSISKKKYKTLSKSDLGINSSLSFCTTSPDGYLWIGTYNGDYMQAVSQYINDLQHTYISFNSLAYAFTFDDTTNKLSKRGYMAIPNCCQGMCFDYFGKDYSTGELRLLVYFSVNFIDHSELIRFRVNNRQYDCNGIFKLSLTGKSSWKTPLMMQELCLSETRDIYALFESKSHVYCNPYYTYKDKNRAFLSNLPGIRESNVVLMDI